MTEFASSRKPSTMGPLIENLKKLKFFKSQASLYGADILVPYLYLMEPYILREGMEILDILDLYVVVEGGVKTITHDFVPLVETFREGMSVEIPSDKTGSIVALSDSKLIKVNKAKQLKSTYWGEINKLEKERLAKAREYNRQIRQSPKLLQCKENMERMDFFKKLGSYDLYEILVESKQVTLSKGSFTHTPNSPVNYVGFVVSGKVRVYFEDEESLRETKLNVSKYYAHRKKKNHINFYSECESGEWLGI